MNEVFASLLAERIALLRLSFVASSRAMFVNSQGTLRHAGEFGTYREAILRDFLRMFVPARLDVGSGFLIASSGEVSTQTDLIVYDPSVAPRLESAERQRFYFAESVCAVGEVKSRLTKQQLKEALRKLARVKAVADQLSSSIPVHRDRSLGTQPFDREQHVYDQVFSFLICESCDIDPEALVNEVDGWYPVGTPNHCKHNMVLSLNDGLLVYVDSNDMPWVYPPTSALPSRPRFVKFAAGDDSHVAIFVSNLYTAMSSATTLHPEMPRYLRTVSTNRMRYDADP